SSSTTRSLTVDPVATAAQTGPAPPPPPPITGLPNPVAGQTVNIAPVKPVVLVKQPGAPRFVPLTAPAQVQVGSIIDTRKGRVRITIDNGHGGFDTADFYEGVFKILQRKATTAFATMQLVGGRFRGCPKAPKVRIARKRGGPHRSIRHLWGE